jgi:hypothetical protein
MGAEPGPGATVPAGGGVPGNGRELGASFMLGRGTFPQSEGQDRSERGLPESGNDVSLTRTARAPRLRRFAPLTLCTLA